MRPSLILMSARAARTIESVVEAASAFFRAESVTRLNIYDHERNPERGGVGPWVVGLS